MVRSCNFLKYRNTKKYNNNFNELCRLYFKKKKLLKNYLNICITNCEKNNIINKYSYLIYYYVTEKKNYLLPILEYHMSRWFTFAIKEM